ncbi:Redox-sensing transcriptional repressor rex [Limihaloglobus sulfuriphilus]|uniref:Redox-sensing transcriptional repressor Rex n=1 Tax=Limihaloglobus sulfuriphilus TaxID=1851148 RepID=A0A1Q2MFX8_9BACT|nr:redox-sensing transcriptional repressor Rex [Limihaloglobus sulfuriphilus]AQQ71606.1 Redox-sensing transcriptional repressor rex [Limihaloglobus sulfuriphilus]
METKEIKSISKAAIRRMPLYLSLVKQQIAMGEKTLSSTFIAEKLNTEAIQVRKDLAATGVVGQPRLGFCSEELAAAIERLLGWDNLQEAFLIGAGNLGSALIGYEPFIENGLNIVAAFDNDSDKIGTEIRGVKVLSIDRLENLIGRMHIKLAILTVPVEVAQQTAERLVSDGIEAIWNFTPTKIIVPDEVIVERTDLAAGYAQISSRLATKAQRKAAENG